jgi:methylenetetrahydrofolate reductase (NADPH)
MAARTLQEAVASSPRAAAVARLLERSRYEVLPLDGVEEQVLTHVPRDVTLTVTASPTKGLGPTFDLAESLVGHGYEVVPHLSARLVRDTAQLAEHVARLRGTGVREVFVVAGDAQQPHGAFDGAASLLEALEALDHPFERIGITGYPESHPLIDDETTIAAMFAKARHASYIASQVCFDPQVTAQWIEDVWGRGTRLPIYVGVPGVVSRAKLLRVSTRIGIGDSLRFLRKNSSFAGRFLRPGGFSPDPLIDGLGRMVESEKVAGFHVFTFNDLEDTEAWRRGHLERIGSRVPAVTS